MVVWVGCDPVNWIPSLDVLTGSWALSAEELNIARNT